VKTVYCQPWSLGGLRRPVELFYDGSTSVARCAHWTWVDDPLKVYQTFSYYICYFKRSVFWRIERFLVFEHAERGLGVLPVAREANMVVYLNSSVSDGWVK